MVATRTVAAAATGSPRLGAAASISTVAAAADVVVRDAAAVGLLAVLLGDHATLVGNPQAAFGAKGFKINPGFHEMVFNPAPGFVNGKGQSTPDWPFE